MVAKPRLALRGHQLVGEEPSKDWVCQSKADAIRSEKKPVLGSLDSSRSLNRALPGKHDVASLEDVFGESADRLGPDPRCVWSDSELALTDLAH